MTPDDPTERTLVDLAEFQRNHYFGKYRGIVEDVDDPLGIGRIRAQVPAVYADQQSPWAMPCVPFAGADHGLVLLPETGDGVWIEFEAGDISRPIWTGFWWGQDELPQPGAPQTYALVTSGGHQLILDDSAGEIKLIHSGGAEFVMTGDSIKLSIGGKQIEITSASVNVNEGSLEVT